MKLRTGIVAACALLLAALPASAGAACGDALGAGRLLAASPRYDVAFRPDPAPIGVSRHFALDVVVCPKAGAPQPSELVVDAVMPEHRHGMNYRPSVTRVAPGRYRAEGLLFHMPGAWEIRFELATPVGSERPSLRHEVP